MGTSTLAQHRTPAQYACYLLRSLSRPNHTYVGSTPDPVRRIRQHNGLIKHGAFMTRMARPWTMDALVFGFPSRIAALQFEWSWQSPHVSRHLREAGVCGDHAVHTGRSALPLFPSDRVETYKGRNGKVRTKARVSSVPEQRLIVMRALLASEPFCFWGLSVAFMTEVAYAQWLYLERQVKQVPRYEQGRVTGRTLSSPFPRTVCDFRGVDGLRVPLEQNGAAFPPLREAETASAWQKSQQKPKRTKQPAPLSAWAEAMPPARDAAALNFSWAHLASAPSAHFPPLPKTRGRTRNLLPLAAPDLTAAEIERRLLATQPAHVTCALCKQPIHKHDPTSYTTCPEASLTDTGVDACADHFHLECLARTATDTAHQRTFCLPRAVA
ncbi:Slx1p [Malassezia vespertilionis]|uniref:Slx1p n=1 Tax=Malassezia vespertilionis TaxID=2020962 RepID=A0A2N1J9I8_9BASI|nr:Slx1p [Malassezia vespertilionis]